MEASKVLIVVNPSPDVEIPLWIRQVGSIHDSSVLGDAGEDGSGKDIFGKRAVVIEIVGDARFIDDEDGVEVRLAGEEEYVCAFPPGSVFQIRRYIGKGFEVSNPPHLCWDCAELSGEIEEREIRKGEIIATRFVCGFCRRRWWWGFKTKGGIESA